MKERLVNNLQERERERALICLLLLIKFYIEEHKDNVRGINFETDLIRFIINFAISNSQKKKEKTLTKRKGSVLSWVN